MPLEVKPVFAMEWLKLEELTGNCNKGIRSKLLLPVLLWPISIPKNWTSTLSIIKYRSYNKVIEGGERGEITRRVVIRYAKILSYQSSNWMFWRWEILGHFFPTPSRQHSVTIGQSSMINFPTPILDKLWCLSKQGQANRPDRPTDQWCQKSIKSM